MVSDERGDDTRGQTRTLESVAASVLIIAAIVFMLQSSIITPLSASTTNQLLEERQQDLATDVLSSAANSDELREAIRYWDSDRRGFYNATREGYTSGAALESRGLAFGETLTDTFGNRRVSYNVYVYSPRYAGEPASVPADGARFSRESEALVYQGSPSDSAVSASTYVTLYDDDRILDADGNPTGKTLTNSSRFYADEAIGSNNPIYNVVEVRIVIWQA